MQVLVARYQEAHNNVTHKLTEIDEALESIINLRNEQDALLRMIIGKQLRRQKGGVLHSSGSAPSRRS